MARVLTMRESVLSTDQRDRFLAAARERRARLAVAQCNYWVFEDVSAGDIIVEFVEARSTEVLEAVLARESPGTTATRLYREVELD